jgi:hypothetical protein
VERIEELKQKALKKPESAAQPAQQQAPIEAKPKEES